MICQLNHVADLHRAYGNMHRVMHISSLHSEKAQIPFSESGVWYV